MPRQRATWLKPSAWDLHQGKATDKAAGCALFGTKLTAAPGWRSAWGRKA